MKVIRPTRICFGAANAMPLSPYPGEGQHNDMAQVERVPTKII
jgi:hypothetical protein